MFPLSDDLAHRAATFVMATFLIGFGVFCMFLGKRSSSEDAAHAGSGLLSAIIVGSVLIWLGLGSLSGVGLGRFDHYYETHPAVWSGARLFSRMVGGVLLIGCLALFVINRQGTQK